MKVLYNGNVPAYQSEEAAGADLRTSTDITLNPGEIRLISTGTKLCIPKGYYGQVCIRSSIGSCGITMANSVGIIDSDYRGEIKIPLWNTTEDVYSITQGYRIAQIILVKHARADFKYAPELPNSSRGEGGFGSTNQ